METDKISVWAYYKDMGLDDAVRKAAGKEDFGSGTDLETMQRDMSFFASNMGHARRMKARIKKVKGVTKVEIHGE